MAISKITLYYITPFANVFSMRFEITRLWWDKKSLWRMHVPRLINTINHGVFFIAWKLIVWPYQYFQKNSWSRTRSELVEEARNRPCDRRLSGRYRSGTHSGGGWRFTVSPQRRLLIREGAELWNRKASDNLIDWAFCRHGPVVVKAGTDEIIAFFVRHRSNS